MYSANVDMQLKTELKRKAIHLSSIWMVIVYYFSSKYSMTQLMLILTSITLFIDYMRFRSAPIKTFVDKTFSGLMRPYELDPAKQKFTGASYMLLSFFICVVMFSKDIAMCSMLILIISDSAASIIGRMYGRIQYFGKTVEGTLAFILSGITSVIILDYFVDQAFAFTFSACMSVLIVSLVEVFSSKVKIDDNFSIPIAFGLCMAGFIHIFDILSY